jgi:hypothetical protein
MPWGLPAHEQPLNEWMELIEHQAKWHAYCLTFGESIRCKQLMGAENWKRFNSCYVDSYVGDRIIRKEFVPILLEKLREAIADQVIQKLEK